MAKRVIPDIVVGRLPVYLRALNFLIAEGRQVTSSQELGDRLGISSAQIRKDLSHFGEFGKQGTGYDIAFLRRQLSEILKVDRIWDVALVGAGNLGKAIADIVNYHWHIATSTVVLLLSSLQVLTLGMLADLISKKGSI